MNEPHNAIDLAIGHSKSGSLMVPGWTPHFWGSVVPKHTKTHHSGRRSSQTQLCTCLGLHHRRSTHHLRRRHLGGSLNQKALQKRHPPWAIRPKRDRKRFETSKTKDFDMLQKAALLRHPIWRRPLTRVSTGRRRVESPANSSRGEFVSGKGRLVGLSAATVVVYKEKSQDHQTPSSSFFLPPSNKRLKMVLKKTKHSAMSSAEFRIFKRFPPSSSAVFIHVHPRSAQFSAWHHRKHVAPHAPLPGRLRFLGSSAKPATSHEPRGLRGTDPDGRTQRHVSSGREGGKLR